MLREGLFARFLNSDLSKELSPSCRQLIYDHHDWVNTWAARRRGRPHVFGNVLSQVQEDCGAISELTFQQKLRGLEQAPLAEKQFCFTHGSECSIWDTVDLDFSGLPCQDNLRANTKRLFEQGRYAPCFIVWARKHRELGTRLLILENTPDARRT